MFRASAPDIDPFPRPASSSRHRAVRDDSSPIAAGPGPELSGE